MASIKQQIGDWLIGVTEREMIDLRRSATGEAVQSLRVVPTQEGIDIMGVDYWTEINEGVPAGTFVELADLQKWANARSSMYGDSLPPLSAIQRKLFAKGSSTPEDRLHVTSKVLAKHDARLSEWVDIYIQDMIKIEI